MQALHLVSHRTRFLFSVTHPPLSELQPWSCGKEPFDSSRSLQPPPQAVCKPRSCCSLLVTNGKASGRRKAQMKAAGLEKRSISDLWIFFKQHLILYSTVTFPAVIESGSDAKLCASLLKPQESLTMTISLLDEKDRTTQLVQQSSSMPFHRCFSFQAPRVNGESVQKMKVEVEGRVFKVTEERKVMFRLYLPLTFIQTDKPIYNPGQTVYFRVVNLNAKFVPLDQMYSLVVVENNNDNRIGQWTNVSSTRWILQLSHKLNPEAQVGMYTLGAFIGEQMFSHVFEVKKYVLPKFDVTVNAPQMFSVGDVGLKVEACAKYTYGQPVPGQALVEVCREPLYTDVAVPGFTRQCLNKAARISVSSFNGTPISNKAVYLLDGNSWPTKVLLNLTTNQNGLATFSLNTATLPKAALNLVASATPSIVYSYKSAYFATDKRVVKLLQTGSPNIPASSELSIVKLEQPLKCGATFPVTVKYSLAGEAGSYSADIIYMALSRGVIVLYGFKTVTVRVSDKVTSGSVSFQLSVFVDMAPAVQILAYCILPSENVVVASASFDTEMCFQNKLPDEDNVLTVSAQAGSLCGLSAVDQSVLIMESGRRLSPKMVFDLLPRLSGYPYSVEDETECLLFRSRPSMGMKIATNIAVLGLRCKEYEAAIEEEAVAAASPGDEAARGKRFFDVTIRTYFPETWIWQLAQVGDTGSTRVPLKVPDTITTWETEAFCLSSKGFGLALPVKLTIFQPFFLELSLPYSIIRGESFELTATVFNYLSKCIMVQVNPARSSAFTLQPLDKLYSSCLCTNGRKTFKWVFSFCSRSVYNISLPVCTIGPVNVTVSAQAEQSPPQCGTEVVIVLERGRIDIVARSLLVLPEGVERIFTQSWLPCPKGSVVSEAVTLTFPTNVIQGSARCSVLVTGDIMGRALKNLDKLLQMPTGCGEQRMIYLGPNIYILQYLEVTGQLTAAIRLHATGYLQSGYQGLLNYRHSDGSFSTFGYDESNTWIQSSPMLLYCLRPVVGNLGNTYAMALLAYTFSLAGENNTRAQLFTVLDNSAISEGTMLHWSQTSSGGTLSVEISSYVLLAVLSVQPLTMANLGYAKRIVNWLVTQQNPSGGFSSTQDTVVALQALSLYSTDVFSLEGSSVITVQSSVAGGDSFSFDVNRDNRLLYQEKPLKSVPGKYSVRATGSTVQVACFYNIPTPIKVARTLSVEAKVTGDCQPLEANLMLSFTVKYDGPKSSTNMVLVDIKLLSGFVQIRHRLGSPPNSFAPLVEQVDTIDDHVLVYLNEVPKGVPMSYNLQLKLSFDCKNLKSDQSDSFETTYTSPCP
ncbi:hypothetical protein G5714_020095 [Onychostoma macrolepis]|uniref:Uncharacterized protein n=1 Tax=Onychostoma macrolepis TaxID=369639 RepID=A0A7J6BYA0_9TELE|nr:hypothetical protein G5714_020095 [Onychostoma macrolepis]